MRGSETKPGNELEHARNAYASRAWLDAYGSFASADSADPLAPADLELLATTAYMLGRDDEWGTAHERAHRLYLDAGDVERAARCAFWIGLGLALRGDVGPASGWLGRAQRLLEGASSDCVERGFLLIPQAIQLIGAGEFAAATATAAEAVAIAGRFDDRDLFALGVLTQGQALTLDGHVQEGLALLDEAMVAVTAEELSPVIMGLVYCAVILACQQVFEIRRAREWTLALDRWWKRQPDLVAFTGRCLVHRAEILQLGGSWPDALEEARRAGRRFIETNNAAAGLAHYREGELLRLQGDLSAAEKAYHRARGSGWEPQPGLAQLRLAQGRADAAAAAIRRANGETTDPLRRAALLPAYVEIMLALGAGDEAREACSELEQVAARYSSAMLTAMVAHARGAVDLAGGDARSALIFLRRALEGWQALEAPYEVARTRVLVGLACRALGDDDAYALELEGALAAFRELGASPDVARVEKLVTGSAPDDSHGLSARELEVLRLLAAGKSNRDIASALVISEHTVARHVQNIFAKLRVSSRSAATAFAFEHDLV
jgi:DNA-binding CsgD family transcriptional regulator